MSMREKHMLVTRRGIQIALGTLWLIDGLLQLQPRMFTADFANDVIAPAAQGQPWFVTNPMQFFIHVFLAQPLLFNACIAAIQIGIGALILLKKTTQIGLWSSIFWGLFVWYIGEGLGGLASGHALLLMGAPGAALIYALLALGTLSRRDKGQKKVSDTRPAYWLLIAWTVLWIGGSLYQVLPGQNTMSDVSAMISMNASSAPTWMASVDTSVARILTNMSGTMAPENGMSMQQDQGGSEPWPLLLLVGMQIYIGLAVFIPGFLRQSAIILGCLLALLYWVVGQSMGAYFSGLATDPSTGPLVILLGIAVLGCTQRDEMIRSYWRRLGTAFMAEIRAFNEG